MKHMLLFGSVGVVSGNLQSSGHKGSEATMLRKRLFNAAFVAVCVCLIVSLIINIVYNKRINREHQYKHILYNQLMADVYQASGFGGKSDFPGFQRAAVNMGYAASVLNDLYFQASMVDHATMKVTQPIQESANFVSYISLALVGQNETFLTGPGNKTVITINPTQAKSLVLKIYAIISKNLVNGYDIPDNKINAVYTGIDNLIPVDFRTLPVLGYFNR